MNEPFFIPYDRARRTSLITEDIVSRFSALIGDMDSFHVSDEWATATVFKKRIAHGIHLSTFISTLVGQELPGFGTIYCFQTYEFRKPVFWGEAIEIEVVILEKLPHHRLRTSTLV